MDRKEPALDRSSTPLTERVAVTWKTVREAAVPVAEPSAADTPVAGEPPALESAAPRTGAALTEDERARLAAALAPALEAALRETLAQTLELALQNATHRIRADLERSLKAMVREALDKELSAEKIGRLLASDESRAA